MMLSNRHIFFPGKLRKFLDEKQMTTIFHNFKLVTLESSFIVRTFFFVIFGFTIVLTNLWDLKVWIVSTMIMCILFGTRYAYFRFIIRKNIFPEIWMAPRGLITILLFFSIPRELVVEKFNTGVLLLVILISSIMMAISLIRYRKMAKQEGLAVAVELSGNGSNDELPEVTDGSRTD